MATNSPSSTARLMSRSTSVRRARLAVALCDAGEFEDGHASPSPHGSCRVGEGGLQREHERSSRKPMMPMVSTATMMRASDVDEPFWNSSQTNLPRPGFCASISAAISTIQPTPSDRRSPVKISGSAEGRTSLRIVVDGRKLQHLADVDQVLVDRGDAERGVDQRRPQRAERHGDGRDDQRLGQRVARHRHRPRRRPWSRSAARRAATPA